MDALTRTWFLRRKRRLSDQSQKRPACTDDFETIRVLGKGSFGTVRLVRMKETREVFAMKELDKKHIESKKQIVHTMCERRVLERTDNPFLVKLHYAFQTPDKLYMVQDYCKGGEINFHLYSFGRFPESWATVWAGELTLALEHLHSHEIIYRDLKPENILLDDEGHIKLVDFGMCKEGVASPVTGARSMCGTPEYFAPEVLEGRGHGTAVDWWALGMVTYEMLTGLSPWYTNNRKVLFERIRYAPLTFPHHVTRAARSLILGLLERDPKQRMGAEKVKAHKWFEHIDWDLLSQRRIKPGFSPITRECREYSLSTDTSNFDENFTKLPFEVLPTSKSKRHYTEAQRLRRLSGFSFDPRERKNSVEKPVSRRTSSFDTFMRRFYGHAHDHCEQHETGGKHRSPKQRKKSFLGLKKRGSSFRTLALKLTRRSTGGSPSAASRENAGRRASFPSSSTSATENGKKVRPSKLRGKSKASSFKIRRLTSLFSSSNQP